MIRLASAIFGVALLVFSPPAASAQTSSAPASPLGGAFAASFRLLMLEHAGRIVFQEKTRRELPGNFVVDYRRSLKVPTTWNDGDGWFVNYVGHPIHGAAAGRTWLVHHPDQDVELGLSKKYWVSRAWAAQWAAIYSLQFEIGPVSEASIGNVGMRPNTTGWVDHVVTPVGALGFIVAEDALDQHLIKLIERQTSNRFLRGGARILLNPSRSLANVADGRVPWYRTRGGLR